MSNEFDLRPEVIFIEYDRVIKNSDQFLLPKLAGPLYDLYKDTLHLDTLKGVDRDTALLLSLAMKENNLFDSLKRVDLSEDEVDEGFDHLYYRYDDMFEQCDVLEMGRSLFLLASQKFTERIVIWSRQEDDRIARDLVTRHANLDKIEYIYGNPEEVLNRSEYPFTSFIISDVNLMPIIANYHSFDYSEVMIAGYRFNKFEDEDGKKKLVLDENSFPNHNVKVGEFVPIKLDTKHLKYFINLHDD